MTASFTKKELAVFQRLESPQHIQRFLDSLEYSDEERYRSPRSVLCDRKAHCYDGALFAAAALERLGFPPLITEILPNENDDDHIVALFKRQDHWGSVAKSNFTGLRYREPVYRSLRELMMTYFEPYYNIKGERTMIGYTGALNLHRFRFLNWQVNDAAMEIIGDALDDAKKFFILSPAMKHRLTPVDTRSVEAGLHGAKQSGLYKP
ncbi:MAG: hypothetical protein WAV76_06230 [Bacteroidota bacterium]